MSEYPNCNCKKDEKNSEVKIENEALPQKSNRSKQTTENKTSNDPEDATTSYRSAQRNTLEDITCTPCNQQKCVKPITGTSSNDLVVNPSGTKYAREKSENKLIRDSISKNVVFIKPQKKSTLSDNDIKDYSIIEPETKTEEQESLSNELGEKSGKAGKKYYYTQPETNLLKDIKKLFKIKLKRHKTCAKCINQIDKVPENDCRIKVEAWEKHDKEKCAAEDKDYKLVGELLFPVCSKELFYQLPGVTIRNSQKSYTLNDPDKFGKPELEKRQYAYSEKIIPARLFDWPQDEQNEGEDLIALRRGSSRQVGNCSMCK